MNKKGLILGIFFSNLALLFTALYLLIYFPPAYILVRVFVTAYLLHSYSVAFVGSWLTQRNSESIYVKRIAILTAMFLGISMAVIIWIVWEVI